jgi:uncharacterized membrane protein
MMTWLKHFIVTLIVFFTIDIVWLAFVAKKIYKEQLGFIMSDKPNVLAALAFYLIFIVGLLFFVINPAIEKESFMSALLVGMLFGFVTYSTYDLTNLATLANWPLKITIIDLIWGTSLGGLVSSISYMILTKI